MSANDDYFKLLEHAADGRSLQALPGFQRLMDIYMWV